MKNLTYNDLAALIQLMPEERRKDNVSVLIELGGEFLPISGHEIADENCDTLDAGHYYLVATNE